MLDFSVLMLVGPEEREVHRLGDFLAGLFHYEPDVPSVVLIDDSRRDRQLQRMVPAPQGCRLVSLPNPRQGWGDGWSGGACAGLLAGLAWIRRNRPGDFVIKADTDALVIGPFAQKVAMRFQQRPETGMLGTYLHDPDGSVRPTASWAPTLQSFLRPVCRRGKHLQITLWGRARKIRQALSAAIQNGYRLTEHCQGGAYAVSPKMISRMADAGYLDDPLCWLRSGCTEDLMMGMYTYAVALGLSDFNRGQEPFGVQYRGLPDQPGRLLARGYGLIHCVKDYENFEEKAIREFFRAVRQGSGFAIGKASD